MLNKLVIVTTTLTDSNGNEVAEKGLGSGFIVNGNYLATCYHVIHRPQYSVKEINVDYNFRQINGQMLNDTVGVDLNYNYTNGQYDFSKHTYIDGNYETDFIILKLQKEISHNNLVFNTATNLPKYTPLQVIAFDYTMGAIRSDKITYLFAQFVDGKTDSYQLVSFGIAKQGFSGAPLFNINDEVVGIVQYGANDIDLDYLNKVKAFNFINEQDLNGIKMGYKDQDKQHISFSTNIKYLLDKYINSFK